MQSLKELFKIGKGPSSSHTMGPERAAKNFFSRYPKAERYEVILYGSLARTGKGHLTDEAILNVFRGKKIDLSFNLEEEELPHPNTMDFIAYGSADKILGKMRYLSVGGGTISIDGEPVLPQLEVYPFRNFTELMEYCKIENVPLDEVAYRFERDIKDYLRTVWNTMKEAIERGLKAEGELPGGLHVLRKASMLTEPTPGEVWEMRTKRIICSYAFATSEENAGGGRIVTAPTCGASGVLPAVLYFLYNRDNLSEDTILSALAVAGLIGNVVKANASISGAEAGCQAEIGTATAMAAAAVCRIYNASIDEIEYAAEIALEHQLGLTCDPICGLVQIPCIERNSVAALRALDSAELAHVLCGTRKISFDMIVRIMYNTGKDLHSGYRETAEAGLAAEYTKK